MTAAARPRQRLIQPEVLAQLANLELIARTAVDGALIGLHRSPKFGFSQEFAEYRTYAPGDDLRFIDWNVFARTDRHYVKRYFGDTNAEIVIMLDTSASMASTGDDGYPVSKLDYGRFLAAALSHLASRQHDAVGYLAFDDGIRDFRSPSARSLARQEIYHLLDAVEARGETNWTKAIGYLGARLAKRSMLIILSDFYCSPAELAAALAGLAACGHDLLLIQILAPEERAPEAARGLTLRDAETARVIEVSPEDLATGYRERLATHIDAVRSATLQLGGHYLGVDTDQPLDQALTRYLRFRARHP